MMPLNVQSLTWGSFTAVNPLAGVRFVETHEALAETTEVDRAKVRSLSRAIRRRRKRPLPMRKKPVAYQVGNTIYVHPAIMAQMKAQLDRETEHALTVWRP